MNNKIFITGGTGYIGSRLIPELIRNGYDVDALVRKGSESKLPEGCKIIPGDALDKTTYENSVLGSNTFIHLIGVHHPGPGKKDEFKRIDLVSIEQAVSSALKARVKHFIYLSVAHPAPIMKEFIEVRMKGEELLRQSGMNTTFVKPWYVLGPGHYWPYLLIPFYKLIEIIPGAKATALRLGLNKINQIIKCLTYAAKYPPEGVRSFDVKDIRNF